MDELFWTLAIGSLAIVVVAGVPLLLESRRLDRRYGKDKR